MSSKLFILEYTFNLIHEKKNNGSVNNRFSYFVYKPHFGHRPKVKFEINDEQSL